MDMKKLNIPTLEGPNWGEYVLKLQAAFQIFDCWDIVKGEILTAAGTRLAALSLPQGLSLPVVAYLIMSFLPFPFA